MKNLNMIAACSDLGVHINGSNLGPKVLLEKINHFHNIKNIIEINYDSNYQKELEKENKKKNLAQINLLNEKLYTAVKKTLESGQFPITLGGDHSIVIASALASISQYQHLGIIWFDAHGDYNTFETTITGNIHGLPFAVVTGYEKRLLTPFHHGSYFRPENAVLLGARDIDLPCELNNLKDAGVTIITTEDIRKYGIEEMSKKAFQIASHGTNGIHVSYDLDCIDPNITPGVSIPAPNGLNLDEAYGFLNAIIQNKEKIKSLDLVEFNPLLDINHQTEAIAIHILNECIQCL